MEAQTILVADGERSSRNGLGDVLAGAGYIVREANSGAEALAMTRADQPQLVLLDLALADMSGYLVCRVLRDEYGNTVSIILLSNGRMDPLERARDRRNSRDQARHDHHLRPAPDHEAQGSEPGRGGCMVSPEAPLGVEAPFLATAVLDAMGAM